MDKRLHRGGCHCGAVAYEFLAPARVTVQACNCSICAPCGYLHLIVPGADFRLLRGLESLSRYTFNSGVAQHLFCRICGVKSYYVPRSNPDGFSINLRCVAPGSIEHAEIEAFDGQNWEANAAALAQLSKAD